MRCCRHFIPRITAKTETRFKQDIGAGGSGGGGGGSDGVHTGCWPCALLLLSESQSRREFRGKKNKKIGAQVRRVQQ